MGEASPATTRSSAYRCDAYLAETFARGIDQAMHGDWQSAKPCFPGGRQGVIYALAAVAKHDRANVRKALDAAAAAPGTQRDFLHQAALRIAMATHDDALAESYLHDFNPGNADVTADTLRLYDAWAAGRSDKSGQQRAADSLAAMRRTAVDILAEAGFRMKAAQHRNELPLDRPPGP